MGQIAENLELVKKRIETAARRAGRDSTEIKLVAVSKNKTAEEIAEAYKAGQRCFGENYAQELKEKYNQLKKLSPSPHLTPPATKTLAGKQGGREVVDVNKIEWHFIGHLQKNKAKIIAPIVSWMETVDSLELAAALDKRATHPLNCLIEVNIGEEETKAGVPLSKLETLVEGFSNYKNLNLKGLMIIPPYSSDPEISRPYFKKLKEVFLEFSLTELSMGMSHDFEVAIEEGATIIRVGTAIFGERK